MTDDTFDQSGKGSPAKRCSWPMPASCCFTPSGTALVTRVRSVGASSISVPGGSVPSEGAGGSLRGNSADHDQAPRENSASVASVRQKQRANHRSNCDPGVGFISRHSEKTWLSRANCTARFKFTLTLYLIACTIPNSVRLMAFLCRFESVRLVAASRR